MGLFDRFLGKKTQPAKAPGSPAPAANSPTEQKDLIKVYDSYGRELLITRQQWRDNVLLGNIKNVWDKPDELYNLIVTALQDGFRSDVVEAAKQLYAIDPVPSRGACIWGIVLMEEGRVNEAERVYRDFLKRHGEDGVILTNLAKVHAKRNEDAKSLEVLWHALEIQPNQDNAVAWYESIFRERDGAAAGQEALRRITALPGSWRAQLWLARSALEARDLEKAMTFYREILSRFARPAPGDALMQISGDLGNRGHLVEILQLVEPCFEVATHGLQVGNNLIKAHLELGQVDAARKIVNQLYSFKRPDWKEALSYWDTEIAKTNIAATPAQPNAPLKLAMLSIEGPIWLDTSSAAGELFPAKSPEAIKICFLGSSAEITTNSQRAERQMSDAPGRLSRAVPLFLAEQIEFGSNAHAETLMPWIAEAAGGFVLSGGAWNDDGAANYARQNESKSDYVVITHLKCQNDPWAVELRLVRTIDAKCLGTLRVSFPPLRPEQAIPELAQRLLVLLSQHADVERQAFPELYQTPPPAAASFYLLRLEQLLAVRCTAMPGVRSEFLSGEREIIDGNIQLCLNWPLNVVTRLLLSQTLRTMKKVRPEVISEFKERILLLQKEKPLKEPAHSIVDRLIDDALSMPS